MKINLLLKRKALKDNYTIGDLYINGEFFCNTIEDKVRDLNKDGDLNDPGETKVMHKTAIPYGKYRVIVNLSPKFKKRLPRLLNVPHFDGVLIHGGLNENSSSGCIIIGVNDVVGQVHQSKEKLAELLLILDRNDVTEIWIEII